MCGSATANGRQECVILLQLQAGTSCIRSSAQQGHPGLLVLSVHMRVSPQGFAYVIPPGCCDTPAAPGPRHDGGEDSLGRHAHRRVVHVRKGTCHAAVGGQQLALARADGGRGRRGAGGAGGGNDGVDPARGGGRVARGWARDLLGASKAAEGLVWEAVWETQQGQNRGITGARGWVAPPTAWLRSLWPQGMSACQHQKLYRKCRC